jgi:Melibiase
MIRASMVRVTIASAITAFVCLAPMRAQTPADPPNAPARAAWTNGSFSLEYGNAPIAGGSVAADAGASIDYRPLVADADGVVTQAIKWTARGRGGLRLDLTVTGSDEAFPVEVDRPVQPQTIVRVSIGPSHSLLNRGVYDRHADWALSIDGGPVATVTPMSSTDRATIFHLVATGPEIVLRFRPRYYQRHRGLKYFRPWTYRAWRRSVAGWTSWYAFRDAVTAANIADTAAVVAEALAPFGYEYLQIDDGYQQTPIGAPDTWLTANRKFPGGLDALRRSITDRGLKPGIWTNVSFAARDYALAHPDFFVRGPDDRPASGNWIGYVMDGANPATLDTLVTPVYRGLREMGWQYFKVDALRHLRYEGYNSFADYFEKRQQDRADVFRAVAQSIVTAIGPDAFKLMCWGVRPELVGLFDGCRLGNDGFGYGGFAEYNSFNNVVWRNDPDHIELSQPDAYRATTIASLTGSLLMLTDEPAVYRTDRVEAARRTVPVLFALPGQIYDVDPSRSSQIARADIEVSGSGPRPFDATQRLTTHYLYAAEINRPFERWMALVRTGGDAAPIRFADLGLSADEEQIVFEFWTKTLAGSFTGAFTPGPVDARYGVQDFCLHARQPHPQVVATNRHVSCGAYDLSGIDWRDGTLSGTSEVVGGDTYEIYITEPAGFTFETASVEGARLVSTARAGALRVLRIEADTNGRVTWRARWASAI